MQHTHSAFTFSQHLLVPLLAGMLLLATGCSSTHRVMEPSSEQRASQLDAYDYSRVTEEVSGKTVTAFLRDGREMELQNLYVRPDSTMGTGPDGDQISFPTSMVKKVESKKRGGDF